MRLVPPPLRIGPNDGFERADLFEYRTFGEHLANIVKALTAPSVIALDGAWGSGKSVFVRQWAGLLRNEKVPVVLFDAHKHDHDQDAFFAIASEVCAQAPVPADQEQSLLKKVGDAVRILVPVLANAALSLSTAGALKSADLEAPTDSDPPGFWKRHIDSLDQYRCGVRHLREGLSALATDDAPLVVIVDELDRCRPTFALSVLDRVKHLFDAERVCFVLVGDYSQLRRLVADQYGMSRKHAIRYLDKYFHLSFRLPATSLTRSVGEEDATGVQYLRHLWVETDLSKSTMIPDLDHDPALMPGFHALIDAHRMSLRSVERVVSSLVLFCSAVRSHVFSIELIVGLSIMRVLDPALYDRARRRRLTNDAVESFMRFSEWQCNKIATHYRNVWTRAIAQASSTGENGGPEMVEGDGLLRVVHLPFDVVVTICRYMDQVAQDDRS